MKTMLIVAIAVLVLGAAVFVAGTLLPKTTEATRSVVLPASVARVFETVTDIPGQSAWRSDIGTIEPAADGQSWVEITKDGDRIAFTLKERRPNERFAIADVSARGFSGDWVGEFAADGEGTRLTVVERVTIPNPLVRLISRVIAPPGSHADLYLANLRKALS